jgi:hypothetical protein
MEYEIELALGASRMDERERKKETSDAVRWHQWTQPDRPVDLQLVSVKRPLSKREIMLKEA